jgi:hypothetical protein
MGSEQQREQQTLVDLRTHLTVVTLAVSQLRRRHGDTHDIDRLCSFAETAITQLKEDIAAMEPSPSDDVERLGTGPMALPSPVPKADLHDQETRPIHLPVNLPNDPRS